jgi:hypothetical protein
VTLLSPRKEKERETLLVIARTLQDISHGDKKKIGSRTDCHLMSGSLALGYGVENIDPSAKSTKNMYANCLKMPNN